MDVQSKKCDKCKTIFSEKVDLDKFVRTTVMIQKQGSGPGGPGPGMGGPGSESKFVDLCDACNVLAGEGNTIADKAMGVITPLLA